MRHPAISENQLRLYVDQSTLARGYTNGVISTTIMRTDTTPGEAFVSSCINHKPQNVEIAESWKKHITVPTTSALDAVYPVLQQNAALDQVFRYQDLHKVKDELTATTSP